MKFTQEYCDLVNALREFEAAHARWMSLSVFTPEGESAKQFKNSCLCRYDEARKAWEKSKLKGDQSQALEGGKVKWGVIVPDSTKHH